MIDEEYILTEELSNELPRDVGSRHVINVREPADNDPDGIYVESVTLDSDTFAYRLRTFSLDTDWETGGIDDLADFVTGAYEHARDNELIHIAEAAKLAGVSVQAVSQAIDAGRLRAYTDHDVPETRRYRRRKVSRREVLEKF